MSNTTKTDVGRVVMRLAELQAEIIAVRGELFALARSHPTFELLEHCAHIEESLRRSENAISRSAISLMLTDKGQEGGGQ